MTLIKSISGIRGTIGGIPGENFTPLDIVRFTSAYGKWIKENRSGEIMVYTGRDSRFLVLWLIHWLIIHLLELELMLLI